MKIFRQIPLKYDELNNLDLRSMFENEDEEPMMFTRLRPCGYVGNRPFDFTGDFHEDDTWAIDQYDEDGEQIYESFLYTSEFEYEQDCKILGLLYSGSFTNYNQDDCSQMFDKPIGKDYEEDFNSLLDYLDADDDIRYFYVSMNPQDVIDAVYNEYEVAQALNLSYLYLEPFGAYIATY